MCHSNRRVVLLSILVGVVSIATLIGIVSLILWRLSHTFGEGDSVAISSDVIFEKAEFGVWTLIDQRRVCIAPNGTPLHVYVGVTECGMSDATVYGVVSDVRSYPVTLYAFCVDTDGSQVGRFASSVALRDHLESRGLSMNLVPIEQFLRELEASR